MKRLVWKLGPFLEAHGATAYQLEMRLRGAVALEAERATQQPSSKKASSAKSPVAFSPNTVYKWAKSASVPERIQTATFERILRALESIAGREVELHEVLAWEDAPEPSSSSKTKLRRTPSRTRGAA